MNRKKTCTPYEGALTTEQQVRIITFLWPYLKKVKGADQVETGGGSKTQTGLLKTLEAILCPSKGDFQVRTESVADSQEDVDAFNSLVAAREYFDKHVKELRDDGVSDDVHVELIHVLEQVCIEPTGERNIPSWQSPMKNC